VTDVVIRLATEPDLPLLPDIERSAGAPFRELGMMAVADDEPPSVEGLRSYLTTGRVWVVTVNDLPVGYLLIGIVDGTAHIEQVSIDSGYAGHGYGRQLIKHAEVWARAQGYPSLTLTTFTEIPWNGPYYRRLGFHPIADEDITPELRALREQEAEHGLDQWPRECLRLDLG